jgi:hypothetical protein
MKKDYKIQAIIFQPFLKTIGFLALMVVSFTMNAQTAEKWYFGNKVVLDFNTNPPTIGAAGNHGTNAGYNVESSSTVTDSVGNLLFMATGNKIFDGATNQQATTLTTTLDAAQGNLIVPKPDNDDNIYNNTKYYSLTVDAVIQACTGVADVGTDRGARYREITITGPAGTANNIAIGAEQTAVATNVAECQVVIPHSNQRDYWWLVHLRNSNTFKVYLITSTGITHNGDVNIGPNFTSCTFVSVLKTNSCYNRIALAVGGQVSLLTFNNGTGNITNAQTWNVAGAYGLEFSPNDTYLYVMQNEVPAIQEHVYAYDVSSNVAATIFGTQRDLGATRPGVDADQKTGHLQLGPDGRIYAAQKTTNGGGHPHYIGAIENPNLPTATFNNTFITVTNTAVDVTMGLPTILRSFLVDTKPVLDLNVALVNDTIFACEDVNINFNYSFIGSVKKTVWDFGDGTIVTDPASLPLAHAYANPGVYTFKLTVTDKCDRVKILQQKVRIAGPPTGTIGCSSNNIVLTGTGTAPDPLKYAWYTAASGGTLLGTGSPLTLNYSSNPASAPASVYIQDFSSTRDFGTVGPTSMPHEYGNGSMTYIETLVPLVLESVKLQEYNDNPPCNAKNITIELRTYPGNALVKTQVVNYAVACKVANTVTLNMLIPTPGKYRLDVTAPSVKWMTYQDGFAPYTVSGIIKNNGESPIGTAKSGPFFNMKVKSYPSCTNRVQVTRNCVLPVEFISFNATKNKEGVLLQWTTATEINNNNFVIERSLDGINFEPLDQVKGAGNSSNLQNYYYSDSDALNGTVYYRILQVDFDGQYSYSTVRSVNFDNALTYSIAPNPNNGEFVIHINSGVPAEKYTVEVLSVLGVVISKEEKAISGNSIGMNLQNLAKGIYMLKVSSDDLSYINKIVIE